jgi:AraC family transcriptional regulator of adaptative response/methylated-DNA-[protein]-cysteine methyltransferase
MMIQRTDRRGRRPRLDAPIPAFASPEERWNAIVAKPAEADGAFVFAVRTTGVACRPTCRARLPRRDNVEFFESIADAKEAGYTPCRRCRPDGPSRREAAQALVQRACGEMIGREGAPTLGDLADLLATSESSVKRAFREVLGITPREFAAALRDERLRALLRRGGDEGASAATITDALYAAGFGTSSRLYETSCDVLGMRPGDFRRGGRQQQVRFATAASRLGIVLVARTPRGVCALSLGDDEASLIAQLRADFSEATMVAHDNDLAALLARIVATIDEASPALPDVPLDLAGTAFQHKVWRAIRDIPRGRSLSYAEVAGAIGRPGSARAVARACAANPAALLVPCHRVVRSDGSPGGYRWGLERKRRLLEDERPL